MGLVTMIPKLFNYGKRAVKAYPYMVFGNSSHTFVNAVKNAPVKDALKIGGRAVEAEIAATKAAQGGFFKAALKSVKNIPRTLAVYTKRGSRLAKAAGKSGIWGGIKGFFKGVGKKMPLIGNILLVASYVPNIITATKEQGIGAGVKETLKSAAGLGGAAIGAAVGGLLGPVGSLVGFVAGEWLTSKIVGKSYTEKKAEQEQKAQEELAALQQYQQQQAQMGAQIPFQGSNPYMSNPYAYDPYGAANPYANDIMMQQMPFNIIA